jgi:hypothetical protein
MKRLTTRTREFRSPSRWILFCAAVLLAPAFGAMAAPWGGEPIPPAPQAAQTPAAPVPQLADGVVYAISPTDADPQITRFVSNNLVLFKNGVAKDANLLVFFPPTGGTPANSWPFMEVAANVGYRVIGLEYDNAISVPQVCGRNPDPACSDRFRQKRVFGDDVTTISTTCQPSRSSRA